MKSLVKSCISYVMSKRWSVIVKIVRGRRKRNKLETFFRAFLSNYSTLSLIPNPILWYYIPRSITGTSKNNKIPALSNKLMEALRRGKQESEQVRETNRAEVDGKRERRREGVVGRELINDVERKRSGVAGLFFSRGAWFLKRVQDESERIKVGLDPIHGPPLSSLIQTTFQSVEK